MRDSGFRGHSFDNAEGAWERTVAEIDAHDGPTLLSHEILGGSKRKIVKRAAQSFPDRTLRVVITCRDLGRQFPAVWQEGVKNGDTVTYEQFLTDTFEAWDGPGAVDRHVAWPEPRLRRRALGLGRPGPRTSRS